MRLLEFQVQGYKSFRAPLRLPDLGRYNIVHGNNNTGKSNLLESIGLFFVGLHALREETRGGPGIGERYARSAQAAEPALDSRPPRRAVRSFDSFTREGYPPDDIFDRRGAQPIVLEAKLQLDPRLDLRPGDPDWLASPIDAALRIERGDGELTVQITRLVRTSDGADLAIGAGNPATTDAAFTLLFERLGPRRAGNVTTPRFALVRADRTLLGEPPEKTGPLATREPLPAGIAETLYDAEGATDVRRERFKTFLSLLERFRPLVGDGQWRMRFIKEMDRPELFLDTGTELIPLRLMGSGVQQLAVLCARLVMTGADVLAIEEPELNLRWYVQRTLRDALGEVVGADGGPSQILFTSHSGLFEIEPPYYVLESSGGGLRVRKTSAEEAWEINQPAAPPAASGARAPRGYMTSEGLVEVPPEVRDRLGLSQGGGVVFVPDKDGLYRMLTNSQYADLFEDREPSP